MLNIEIGGGALRAALDQYRDQLKAGLRVGVGQAGVLIRDEAKARCPVDTENLRRSISSRVEDEGGEVVAKVGTNVEYAIHVEFGHRTRSGTGKKKSALYNRKSGKPTVRAIPGKFFLYGALQAKRTQAGRLIVAAMLKDVKGG